MNELKFPYVLVAERSVLPLIGQVLQGIQTYGNPESISIVVPSAQFDDFKITARCGARVIGEDEVLAGWSLARVKAALPNQPHRAGWYLQQFLKLSFGSYAGIPQYVVWDADTVMLSCVKFTENGLTVFNTAREHHGEYYETFERLFGRAAPLRRSLVSQYMLIETQIVQEMRCAIESRFGKDWITAILSVLPGTSESEFSEYVTYANFLADRYPDRLKLSRTKWFRYGSEIIQDPACEDFDTVRERFSGYAYVAFERHPTSLLKRLWGNGSLLLRRSS